MTDKELFISQCFSDIKDKSEVKYPDNKDRLWIPSNKCSHCSKLIDLEDIDIKVGYWFPVWRSVHKDCLKEAKSLEVFECQKIDCSCNDCFFFKREKESKGYCNKKNIKVTAWSNTNQPQNVDCFKHRLEL